MGAGEEKNREFDFLSEGETSCELRKKFLHLVDYSEKNVHTIYP